MGDGRNFGVDCHRFAGNKSLFLISLFRATKARVQYAKSNGSSNKRRKVWRNFAPVAPSMTR